MTARARRAATPARGFRPSLSEADLARAREVAASAPALSPAEMTELRMLLGGAPTVPATPHSPAA